MLGIMYQCQAGAHALIRELVTSDDQVKAYINKIMSQLNRWMVGGKISKLVVVITSKETGEHVERWQFDVGCFPSSTSSIVAELSRCNSSTS